MRRLVVVAIIAIMVVSLLQVRLQACQCDGRPAFVEVVPHTELVLVGTVVEYGPYLPKNFECYEWMMVEVNDVLVGATDCDIVTLLGDDGRSCRPYITQNNFPIGDQFVFALYSNDLDPQPISMCGAHILLYNDGVVRGKVFSRNSVENMVLAEFRAVLAKVMQNPMPSN